MPNHNRCEQNHRRPGPLAELYHRLYPRPRQVLHVQLAAFSLKQTLATFPDAYGSAIPLPTQGRGARGPRAAGGGAGPGGGGGGAGGGGRAGRAGAGGGAGRGGGRGGGGRGGGGAGGGRGGALGTAPFGMRALRETPTFALRIAG